MGSNDRVFFSECLRDSPRANNQIAGQQPTANKIEMAPMAFAFTTDLLRNFGIPRAGANKTRNTRPQRGILTFPANGEAESQPRANGKPTNLEEDTSSGVCPTGRLNLTKSARKAAFLSSTMMPAKSRISRNQLFFPAAAAGMNLDRSGEGYSRSL